jgi:hypothetical protein
MRDYLRLARARALLRESGTTAVRAVQESLRATRAGLYFASRFVDGEALPALGFLESAVGQLAVSAEPPGESVLRRVRAGWRYPRLVRTAGRELFGSARFAGEQVIARSEHFTLSHLPPRRADGPAPFALLHVGGFIPYGDRIFRFLPEANLYDRFLERGIPVYALEQAGPSPSRPALQAATLERIVAEIDDLGAAAARHHGARLVGVGYCGTALPLLAFCAGRPRRADALLSALLLFVAPIDARHCRPIVDLVNHLPRTAMAAALGSAGLVAGGPGGRELSAVLDAALGTRFNKTALGRFSTGWATPTWADAATESLSPGQRVALATAFWLSTDNAARWPIPAAVASAFHRLYDEGVADDGRTGLTLDGQPLDLGRVARDTRLEVLAFYGERDTVVNEVSGRVLRKVLGPRYHHHVHRHAAHVSYVTEPELWQWQHPRRLDPNPIDALLAACA